MAPINEKISTSSSGATPPLQPIEPVALTERQYIQCKWLESNSIIIDGPAACRSANLLSEFLEQISMADIVARHHPEEVELLGHLRAAIDDISVDISNHIQWVSETM